MLSLGFQFAVLLSQTSLIAADEGIITERPSFVDSSQTMGLGQLQIETGVQDEKDHGSVNTWTIPTLLRCGLAEDWEMRFENDVYQRSNAETSHYVDGWSNLVVGVKHHIGGDQDGGVASAWFAEVELPTGDTPFRGRGARPSARWVTEWDLPANYSFAVMPGLKYDSGDNGRFVSGSFGATLSKNFSEATQAFVELASQQIAKSADGGTQVSFDAGIQYRIGKNVQIDSAIFFGLNGRTPDTTATVGVSTRW